MELKFTRMKIYRKMAFLLLVVILISPRIGSVTEESEAIWGFFGHKRINRMATFTLPPEMISFFKENIEFVTEHAVDPDKRRYATEGEAPRHYIDIDHYAHDGQDPFEAMPRYWDDAVEKFSEDTLQAYGIVPWHIEVMIDRLTHAFKQKDAKYILRTAADLGHYIGDAHVPLHTTENYNGQLTNQKGIHGFWESRIPEMLADDYDYFTGRAKFIENVSESIWDVVYESHHALDSVLVFERNLTAEYESDAKYSYETRGNRTIQVYSENFTRDYDAMMGDMVERKMRGSIIMVGSAWYTAWVLAGQPDLNNLDKPVLSEEEIRKQEELDRKHQEGKIKGRQHQD